MKHNINGKRASSNDQLIKYLHSLITEGDSLLDLGCGPKLYSDPFKNICKKILTIDAWESVNPDIVADLETVNLVSLLDGEKYDYVLMIDFIEHLDKSAGLRLIESVKSITNKKIILLTPLEEIWDDNHKNVNDPSLWCYGNTFDIHKSMWHKDDFIGWQNLELPGLNSYFVGTFSNG
jgi:hypothetical protein